MTWRGVFAGSLMLIALQAVLSTDESSGRVGEGFEWLATLVKAALDPSVPAIPDLTGSSSYNPPGGGSSGGDAEGSAYQADAGQRAQADAEANTLKPRPAPLPPN